MRDNWYPEIVGLGAILAVVVISLVATLVTGIGIGRDAREPEDSIEEIADNLCLGWIQNAGNRDAMSQLVDESVERAEKLDRSPRDIHEMLIVRCPPYAEAASGLPEGAWE